MPPNPSQIVNNMKRSFNKYISAIIVSGNINFDQDPFDTDNLDDWYSIRYKEHDSSGTGMGNLIEAATEKKGFRHRLACEIGAWRRDDPQRTGLGDMIDKLVSLSEAGSVNLYDFTDPENPVQSGTMYISPSKGKFLPKWDGGNKTIRDEYVRQNIVGFILDIDLLVVAKVG